jgi:hypothetical protein
MPRFDDLYLRHHPLRESRRRSEVLQVFEDVHDAARTRQAGLAVLALVDVGAKGSHTETDLAVEQQVDLIREQVAVIHMILQ